MRAETIIKKPVHLRAAMARRTAGGAPADTPKAKTKAKAKAKERRDVGGSFSHPPAKAAGWGNRRQEELLIPRASKEFGKVRNEPVSR
jgi:hypothetical protein